MLQLQINPDARKTLTAGGTSSSEAYSNYIQVSDIWSITNPWKASKRPLTCSAKAIVADSMFAIAYAELGETYWRLYDLTKDTQYVQQASYIVSRRKR